MVGIDSANEDVAPTGLGLLAQSSGNHAERCDLIPSMKKISQSIDPVQSESHRMVGSDSVNEKEISQSVDPVQEELRRMA